jgi:hypothetical protein
VVRRAGIFTVPARRERELEPNSVHAVGIQKRLVGQVVAEQRRLIVTSGIVKAVEANGALGEIVLGSLAEQAPRRLVGIGERDVKPGD